MKRICMILTGISMSLICYSQDDSTKQKADTIKVGTMIIIKTPGENDDKDHGSGSSRRKPYKPSVITTNWLVLDLGFANYTDETNYASTLASGLTGVGVNKDQFEPRTGKSVNVNIWLFLQRLSMIKHVVNLKYGLGIEMNNYRYRSNLKFEEDPTRIILDNSTTYSKNKLAADYVTLPMMLNFDFTPKRKRGFGFSVGASAGYLYNSRQKTITAASGKQKTHDRFELDKWKISYIGELQLGPVTVYGSLARKSMFERILDQTPYAIGIRLSSWE